MKDFVSRVTSRKFLLAVATVIAFVAYKQYDQAVAVVLAYFGVNHIDARVKSAASADTSTPDTPSGE